MTRTPAAISKHLGTQTMKAIRIHNYGGPEVLHYEDAPRPEAQAGEVLVRVHAAGVNPIDWNVPEGHMKDFWPHKFPLISRMGFVRSSRGTWSGCVAIQNRRRGLKPA